MAGPPFPLLREHGSRCARCERAGSRGDTRACPDCRGDGQITWRAFKNEELGLCRACRNFRLVSPDTLGRCFSCHVRAHRAACGCQAWRAAERVHG